MKLGFLTAILDSLSFDQVIHFAGQNAFQCLEVACWPTGKAARRYAGVTHIDVDALTPAAIEHIQQACQQEQVQISSLAFYPNPLDRDAEKSAAAVRHLYKVIDASSQLGVHTVTTFIGRDQTLPLDENLKKYVEVWTPIVRHAEERGVKIAIENCPMLFSIDQWPGGQNLAISPAIWRKMFELIPSDYLGLNFDPSHFIWQQMDYIQPLYEFKHKLFHIHIKDIHVYPEKLTEVGVLATPLEYMAPKIPGHGDIQWGRFLSALNDINYNGYLCLEIEDRAFEATEADRLKALLLSQRYISQFII